MLGEARLLAFESWMNAALHGSDWTAPLDLSANLLGARCAAMVWTDAAACRTALWAGPQASPRLLQVCASLETPRLGEVFEGHEPELGQMAWIKVRPTAAGELLLCVLVEEQGEHQLLCEIANVAASAVTAKGRLASAGANAVLKTVAFDQLAVGVVIIDQHMRLAEPNEACRRILNRADGMSVVQDKLICRDPKDQAALVAAVNRAIAGDPNPGVFKVHRRRGAQSYAVRVFASPESARPQTHCLLMIVDPDEAPSTGGDIWRAMFDLTECELIIAEGLVAGRRIGDIAAKRGVSVETIRSQTKRLFERMNVSSQTQAAVLLSRASPFSPVERQRDDTEVPADA